MMKGFIRMLAMAISLCLLTASALAANTEVLPDYEGSDYRVIESVTSAGDTAYILTRERTQLQLWYWREDMEQAEQAAGELRSARMLTEAELTGGAQAVSVLFSDGEQLYGLNHLDGSVFTISVTDEGIQCVNVCGLENTTPMIGGGTASIFREPLTVLAAGDKLVWHTLGDRSVTDGCIYVYDLNTGYVKQAVAEYVQAVTPYRDGKVLLLCGRYYNHPCEVYVYDPVTDGMTLLGTTPELGDIGGVAYDPALDMLLYQDDTCIMGWKPDGTVRQVSFVPAVADGPLTVLDDTVIYTGARSVLARTLVADFTAAHSLRILGGNLNDVVGKFAKQYEDVPFYYMDIPENGAGYIEMLSKEENVPDLLFLNVADGLRFELTDKPGMVSGVGDFTALRDGGYLLDLSGYPELAAYVETLYPAYRDLVTKDGAIYGIPVASTSYDGWFINKAVMKDMGLTEEDIPTSLTELCAFATRWNEEFVEKYPHYTLLNNTENYRDRFLQAILDNWYGYCQAMGQPVTFDDPVFRELLTALDAMQVDQLDANLQVTNPEASEYKQALIWTGCKLVGNWATYMEEESDRIFIPLTLTPETPYTAAVEDVRLWTVNANTENAEYAAALLTEKTQNLDVIHAYVLQAMNEPVINAYYQSVLDEEYAILAELEASLAESVSPEAVQARIAEQQADIDNLLTRDIYDITPSALENYINVIVPALYIRMPDDYIRDAYTAEKADAINGYAKGDIDAEAFIAAMSDSEE